MSPPRSIGAVLLATLTIVTAVRGAGVAPSPPTWIPPLALPRPRTDFTRPLPVAHRPPVTVAPVIVTAAFAPPPLPARPVAVLPKPRPVVPAGPSPLARRVVYILSRYVEPNYVREEVDRIGPDDAAGFPVLVPALSDAATRHQYPTVRDACHRALDRIAAVGTPRVAPHAPSVAASAQRVPTVGLVRTAGFTYTR